MSNGSDSSPQASSKLQAATAEALKADRAAVASKEKARVIKARLKSARKQVKALKAELKTTRKLARKCAKEAKRARKVLQNWVNGGFKAKKKARKMVPPNGSAFSAKARRPTASLPISGNSG
jgi:hypothetical protein